MEKERDGERENKNWKKADKGVLRIFCNCYIPNIISTKPLYYVGQVQPSQNVLS